MKMTTRAGHVPRTPSRTVLAELPARVVVFLKGVGSNGLARGAMAKGGYDQAAHAEGSKLLAAVCAYDESEITDVDSDAAREAEAEIAKWVQTHFRRLHVAVERLHPDAVNLFDGIEARPASEAVLALATLLERMKHAAPSDVLDTLSRRGLDMNERRRLEQLIEKATTITGTRAEPIRDAREAELVALYRWHSDWAATARAMISRKDVLIALGLADRKRKQAAQASLI